MATPKATRWLDLIAFLLSRRYPVTREEIFDNVRGYTAGGTSKDPESRRRQFERDKDELRALGIGIETADLPRSAGNEPDKGYRLAIQNFYLPYFELQQAGTGSEKVYRGLTRIALSREQMVQVDRGTQRIADHAGGALASAARSLRQKLAFDIQLPDQAVERILAAPAPHDGEGEKTLAVLQQAVMAKATVWCQYYAIGRDTEEPREIEPYGLYFNWGKWYCVGRARDRDALRVFRLDRMRDAKRLADRDARFDVPDDFSIRTYARRAPWELSGREGERVRVSFRFPDSRWVQNQGVGEVVDSVLEDGGAVLEFTVSDPGPFLRWLLTYRDRAEVLSPESIRTELTELRRSVAALYKGIGAE